MAKRFVVERVTETGGRVCPPTIVGIGGTADLCRKLAKIAATRRLGSRCDDPEGAAQERELSAAVNGLGIGPLLVAMDAHGAGLYDDMHKASTERMEAYGANEGA